MKFLITLSLCFGIFNCFAQDAQYQLSDPVNIPQAGWNKVLMLRNGNTILFHFEVRKGIIVKIFDSAHKEIVSRKHICKLLDINDFERSSIKGFYDINGEAVMFIEQAVENKNTLLRLRFDPVTGGLIEEAKVVQSETLLLRTDAYVIKEKNNDNYSVFCFREVTLHRNTKLELMQFNGKHELIRTIPLDVNAGAFRYINMVSANADKNNNICITLQLANDAVASAQQADYYNNNPSTFKKYFYISYLPKGADTFTIKNIPIATDLDAYYASITYNDFANKINLLTLLYKKVFFKQGLNEGRKDKLKSMLLVMNKDDNSANYKWLTNEKVKNTIAQQDSATPPEYNGIPTKIFTDEYGLTTVITEESDMFREQQNGYYVPYTHIGSLGITQLDDTGAELWGQVMPKRQYVRNYLYPIEMVDKGTKFLFRDLPEQAYQNQFATTNCYSSKRNVYLIYNDNAENFNVPTEQSCIPVYVYNATNSVYYKVTSRREVKKYFLFGSPTANESKASFLESADFNEATNTYATLVLNRHDKDYTINVGWCHLN